MVGPQNQPKSIDPQSAQLAERNGPPVKRIALDICQSQRPVPTDLQNREDQAGNGAGVMRIGSASA